VFHYLLPPDLSLRARARVGTTVRGKFALEELLGTGGMASVYRARHRAGTEVALKIVHPELAQRVDTRPWLLREAMLTNAVDHPSVVRVLDDDVDDEGSPMLVMELLCGESLSDHARRLGGRLPVGRVLDIADRTLDVLAAIHDLGIVHCDVKPENLVLCADRLVLLDFGIARASAIDLPALPAEVAFEPMGTPDFMPPEQSAGRWAWVDARSDIYALGATLSLLLCGRAVKGVRSLDGVRAPLRALIDRALAFDPDGRHPSARAMQASTRVVRAEYTKLEYRERHASGVHSIHGAVTSPAKIANAS